ncbi:serine protease [Thiothrix caldifontis]|uniref:Serine protease n=1 Tax=Thiothrix caldifontis TaxID=525918 RepID=A0A1H4AB27_9GAMM|nr:S8 family serine peptidase [Thiothrix caldifontis]SEA33189.1 serine protease [Thiothrix caldifontis]
MLTPKHLRVCALVLAVSASVSSPTVFANAPDKISNAASAPDTDQLIIRFRDNVGTTAADKVLSRLRTEKGEKFAYTKTTHDNAAVFRFEKRKKKADWGKLSVWLKQLPEVEYVEPDFIMNRMEVSAPVTPNDSYLSYQWSLLDAISGIRADQAWGYTAGQRSVVAVVDTGVLPHVDLLPNLLAGYDMIADAAVANDGNGRDSDATDAGDYVLAGECGSTTNINSSWHGTHVAGTIAAAGNNAEGIAGVAYAAKALPVRVLGKCGGYTSDIAAGVIWAAGGTVSGTPANPNPARVINLSLGGASACGSTMQNAINTARGKNAVVVVAAGNSNTDASQFSPANCAGVVTVAATGRNGGRAYYSNYGNVVDLAAPGGSMNTGAADGIVSTLNTGTQTALADTYKYYQGTSMATPHVSGVVALMLAAKPTLTPDQVESLLKSSARAFPQPCASCGTGLLDATAAVQAATNFTAPVDPYAVLLSDLKKNRDLWRTQNLLNYTYVLEQKTGTSSALRLKLTVKAGVLTEGVNLATNKKLSARDLKAKGKTIEQLFTQIETAINSKYAIVKTAYDTTLGYPLDSFLDKSTSITSDNVSLKASSLTKL